jgi:HSP90 family molecular chaperone
LTEYEGNKFQNASKDDLKIGSQARTKEIKESYKELTKWWKDILAGENVESVKVQICSFTTWGGFCSALNFEKVTSSMTGASSGNGNIHNWVIDAGGTG